ncbi:MAG: 2TM domain-containing protein [Burkholderiales bacterium]|nr:2TM domain-containing protein [Burkholderiales bacterium]
MEHEHLVRLARRRAGMKFGFFIHLSVFIAVNTLLFLINQQATPGYTWFPFPLGGWAVGLSIHGLAVYLSGSGLRERMVDDELRKLESRRAPGAR